MSLPAILPPNTISIYGHGSINGIKMLQGNLQFGLIDQMYFGAAVSLVGQSVLFRTNPNQIQLGYNNVQYFLIQEEDIVLTENILS